MMSDITKALRARDLALWQRLHAASLVDSPAMPTERSVTPWFLRAIAGSAAWLAALLLTVAVGILLIDDFRHLPKDAFAAVGAAIALAAGAGLRAKWGTFMTQVLISFSLAGQLLTACGLILFHYDSEPRLITGGVGVGLLAVVLYLLNRVALHRFICGVAMAFALAFILGGDTFEQAFDRGGMLVTSVFLPLALNGVAVGLWAAARPAGAHPGLAPLTWAFTLCATLISWVGGYFSEPLSVVWPVSILMSMLPAIFAALLMWPNRRVAGMPFAVGLPLALLVLAPVWLHIPGVGLAVIWIVGGFALARPLLLAFGLACLPIYLVRYVYMLDMTLLQKSLWLAGAGAGLLLVWGVWQAAINRAGGKSAGDLPATQAIASESAS